MPRATARRIAIVYDCIFPRETGGAERVYVALAEHLAALGCEVTYLTRQGQESPTSPSFSVKGIWQGAIYDAHGVRIPSSALHFSWAVFKYLLRHRNEYDLVIASSTPVLTLLAARFGTLGSRTRILADWVEVWHWRKWTAYSGAAVGGVAFFLQWLALSLTGSATVNSRFTARRVQHYRPGLRPILLGLVDMAATVEAPTPVRGPDVRILSVGRHIADKRVDSLPPAFCRVLRQYPQARLDIVGQGQTTPQVKALVESLGLADRVTFWGRVSDETLADLFAHAHVLAHPSMREGFGLVVAEAAAFGTPSVVVAAEDNAAVELIADGRNGFVAADATPENLATALIKAIDQGQSLRESTLRWFAAARETNGLRQSACQILQQLEAA